MPCKSTWYIENQVLFVHIWGDTDLDDYISYFQQSYEAYDQSDAPVIHTIVDASGVNKQANLIDVQRQSNRCSTGLAQNPAPPVWVDCNGERWPWQCYGAFCDDDGQ